MNKLSPAARHYSSGLLAAGRRVPMRPGQARAIIGECLSYIDAEDERFRCMVHLDHEGALKRAAELDAMLAASNQPLPLHGVPVVVKEIYSVNGMPHSSGSQLPTPELFEPEGFVIGRLRAAGCVFLGKSFSTEFAFGQFNLGRPMPVNPGPYLKSGEMRVTGGSSSGSAGAQAAGYCGFALGTDTGGSVRGPAAMCGVVGFKPSEGLVPTNGIFTLSEQLDTPGWFCNSVADAAAIFATIRGNDPALAETGAVKPGEILLGVPTGDLLAGLDSVVAAAWSESLERLQSAGIRLVSIDLPTVASAEQHFAGALPVELLDRLGRSRVAANLPLLDPVTRARLKPFLAELADPTLSTALSVSRAAAARELEEQAVDAWLVPTVPCVAPPQLELTSPAAALTLQDYVSRNTRYTSLLGHCAINLPLPPMIYGTYPVGLQLAALAGADQQLLSVATEVEAILSA